MRDLFGTSITKLWGSTADVSWLCLNTIPEDGESTKNEAGDDGTTQDRGQRRRKARESAKPNSRPWGPTHSFSSEEDSGYAEEKKVEIDLVMTPISKFSANRSHQGTASTDKLSPDLSPDEEKHDFNPILDSDEPVETIPCTLGKVWNNLQCLEDRTWKEVASEDKKEQNEAEVKEVQTATSQRNNIFDMFDEMCSPCKPKTLDDDFSHQYDDEAPLGISRLAPPNSCFPSVRSLHSTRRSFLRTQSDDPSMATGETPADRRRSRHRKRQEEAINSVNADEDGARAAGDSSTTQEAYEVTPEQVVLVQKDLSSKSIEVNHRSLPVESLELNNETAVELERCISELTMRSSYGEATAKIAENRRMAYYAVGRHHRQSGRGGNRRCYFTGKLILGGAPFYAGSVQQGLRTLVVFCLPSAVGLPLDMERNSSPSTRTPLGSISSHRRPSLSSRSNASVAYSRGNPRSTTGSLLSRKGSKLSRLSSVDDTSVEEELDPNWELDKEYLLSVLPDPNQDLLDEMAERYPAQFETLPIQVRSPHCWKLYVKFCFFSGLPIAEGEMHYKVRDSLAKQYGEEVILSHEVMEAVNGDSAEILRLPNLKTFRYLRKHYHQQSAKLPDSCFQRQAWEMVRPEV
ncbi:hypothetical protein IV203_023466 [Nitzschia inconspicua]|uniref:Uncharacterized protein n=1 Tax=Nitzschia inconspicua TaxID=303405 RepID=A0A9K3KDY8_9STRA|nr:hypothetical protein IV203_023466 [Nitzschia inconspicua]